LANGGARTRRCRELHATSVGDRRVQLADVIEQQRAAASATGSADTALVTRSGEAFA
jgi:hypothetical protein